MEHKFSIFTATFNRGYCIDDVYNSLLNQTLDDFEWIIVNDGSCDDTELKVNRYIAEKKIDIKYIFQENSGKHIAQNKALDIAKGILFLPLDSDDTIVPDALEPLWKTWSGIDENEIQLYSGIGVHCMNTNGEIVGDLWPEDYFVSNDLEINFKYKIHGEKWGAIRTDIMRQYLNPKVKGHYFSESTVWFRIAQKYKKIYINKALRIYESHNDSITKRKTSTTIDENAEAKLYANLIYINEFWRWFFKYDLKSGIIICLSSIKAALNNGTPLVCGKKSLYNSIDFIIPKAIIIICSPYKIMYRLKFFWRKRKC